MACDILACSGAHFSLIACARSLFRVFGGDRIQGMMNMLQIQDMPIESNMLSNALDEAQRKVESYFFGARAGASAACS